MKTATSLLFGTTALSHSFGLRGAQSGPSPLPIFGEGEQGQDQMKLESSPVASPSSLSHPGDSGDTGVSPTESISLTPQGGRGDDDVVEEFSFDIISNSDNYNNHDIYDVGQQKQQQSNHRSLETNNCMNDVSPTNCNSNDVKFQAITGFTLFDEGAYFDETTGLWMEACRGYDDNVRVSFTMNLTVGTARFDVGMYIAVNGNTAMTGQCNIVGLTAGTFGTVIVEEIEKNPDDCLDLKTSGTLAHYPFESMVLKCYDGDGDFKLDFDMGVVWSVNDGTEMCSMTNGISQLPRASPGAKCWYPNDGSSRITLPVFVPNHLSPTSQPSDAPSSMPSSVPSISSEPSATPSKDPSSQPSSQPSVSSQPSSAPSGSPSLSAQPSSAPSSQPSISAQPSSAPSDSPSLSAQPSSAPSKSPSTYPSLLPSSFPSSFPSSRPSLSAQPTSTPSQSPSISAEPSSSPSLAPSDSPSSQPSVSFMPSLKPSQSPSISVEPSSQPSSLPSESPSDAPSLKPSVVPSDAPSLKPSDTPSLEPSAAPSDFPSLKPSQSPTRIPSTAPSSIPSASPTISSQPSISSAPSSNTDHPSLTPSISLEPTAKPSSQPSKSSMPSASPTETPTSAPSASPTGNPYYPDFDNDAQVCKNDGLDPEWMKEIQKLNYLYLSKEECCQTHFWWRITQCMANDHPMYYSNGSYCDQKVFFEDWEAKYTPADWSTSDLFDTVDECCNAKFWWDISGCLSQSPMEMTFTFSFDLKDFVEPTYCQDADAIGNALEQAINSGLGSDSTSTVTFVGCIELIRNADTGTTECGGCLAGSTYSGDYDGTQRDGYESGTGKITSIGVEVSSKSSSCTDAACFQELYDQIIADFSTFLWTGGLTQEIIDVANTRNPNISEFYNVEVDIASFSYQDPMNPLSGEDTTVSSTLVTTTGEFSISGLTLTTQADIDKASVFIEAAILESLGANLPSGSIVTVTDILDDAILYEITIAMDSTAEATAAMSQIESSFVSSSTLTAISDAAISKASSSADTALASAMSTMSIISFSAGTTTEYSADKVTTAGEFVVSGLDTSSFTASQTAETTTNFEEAIAKSLGTSLPDGSSIKVTGIGSTIQYEITSYLAPGSDGGSVVSEIGETLSQVATMQSISASVVSASSTSNDSSLYAAMSGLSVDAFVAGATTGVVFANYYPDWAGEEKTCINTKKTLPLYMKESPDQYLFETKKACCEKWFYYNPLCAGSSTSVVSAAIFKFYPDYSVNACGKKRETEFESWETSIMYDTLDSCCSAKFGYDHLNCCEAPGMGGCETSTTGTSSQVMYLPDWTSNECYSKSESAMSSSDAIFAVSTVKECCQRSFNWNYANCCSQSGGC